MSSPAWHDLLAATPWRALSGTLWRIVETQEEVATMRLVDSALEQSMLEDLLEASKPPVPDLNRPLHYLLYTPFRYPPLMEGTRFGSRFERSLFYGSRKLSTALAETAWYRRRFFNAMQQAPATAKLVSQHTAFSVEIYSERGLCLNEPPFCQYQHLIADKESWRETQKLGSIMREQGTEAFEYLSVRDPERGVNAGLFTPAAFGEDHPSRNLRVLASTEAQGVEFVVDRHQVFRFSYEQ